MAWPGGLALPVRRCPRTETRQETGRAQRASGYTISPRVSAGDSGYKTASLLAGEEQTGASLAQLCPDCTNSPPIPPPHSSQGHSPAWHQGVIFQRAALSLKIRPEAHSRAPCRTRLILTNCPGPFEFRPVAWHGQTGMGPRQKPNIRPCPALPKRRANLRSELLLNSTHRQCLLLNQDRYKCAPPSPFISSLFLRR